MAIYRAGVLAGTISGNIGGICFKNAKGSNTITQRLTRSNQRTESQSFIRSLMPLIAASWHAHTESQRKAWRNFARQKVIINRLGASILLSAWQHFVKYELFLRTAGLSPSNFVPKFYQFPAITALSLNFSNSGTYQITIDPHTGGTVPFNVVHSNRPVRKTFARGQKYFRLVDTHQQLTDSWDIKAAWQSVLGIPQIGEQVRITIRNVQPGTLAAGPITLQTQIKV